MNLLVRSNIDGAPWWALDALFQAVVHAGAESNRQYLRQHPNTPSIESLILAGRVKFRNEPWAGQGLEEIADIPTIIKRGWGDCDDLVAAKLGELWLEDGPSYEPPWPHCKLYPRVVRGTRLHHAEVRLRDGTVIDIAREAGMR
jgi:hypothetical protein